jgi:hypothetical protein
VERKILLKDHIKLNLIKELPTYSVLFERGINGIDDQMCPRCKKEIEDWNHVWRCENNVCTVREVIERAIEEYEVFLEEKQRMEELVILRDINISFIQVLFERSEILIGVTKECELLRGIYNNRFNDLSNL